MKINANVNLSGFVHKSIKVRLKSHYCGLCSSIDQIFFENYNCNPLCWHCFFIVCLFQLYRFYTYACHCPLCHLVLVHRSSLRNIYPQLIRIERINWGHKEIGTVFKMRREREKGLSKSSSESLFFCKSLYELHQKWGDSRLKTNK